MSPLEQIHGERKNAGCEGLGGEKELVFSEYGVSVWEDDRSSQGGWW